MSERKLKSLVREEALEDFSSSELLDQLMVVIRGKGWILIAILAVAIAAALVWGFLGEVPITVQGKGIIVEKNAPLVIQNPTASGSVVEILMQRGDIVGAGQPLLKIGDSEAETNLRTAQADLALLKANDIAATTTEEDSLAKEHEAISRQMDATFATLDRTRKLIKLYEQQVTDQEELSQKKLIPISQLISTRALLFQAEEDEKTRFSQLAQFESQLATKESQYMLNRQQRQQAIKSADSAVEKSQTMATASHRIVAPIRGRIIARHVGLGSVVAPGDAIATILPIDTTEDGKDDPTPIIALVYIEYGTGKQVEPGMIARIGVPFAPTTEYGFIKASVASVASFASDQDVVTRQVGSDALAKSIMGVTVVPLEVKLDLQRNPESTSGLAWTSGEGFPGPIPSLTECTVQITTRLQRPIDLVIPWLKKKMGIDVEPEIGVTSTTSQ